MKTKIRKNVFETNSSSTHSLQIYDHDKYILFKQGEYLFDAGNRKLVKNDEESIEAYIDFVISLHKNGHGWCPSREYIRENLLTYDRLYVTAYGGEIEEQTTPDGKWIAVSFYEEG